MDTTKRLVRSQSDRLLGGVCSGIAQYFNIDLALLRVLWLVFSFFYGIGILLYLIFLIVLPYQENEKEPKSKQSVQWGLLAGVVLVMIGLVTLLQNYWPIPLFFVPDWFEFLSLQWEYVWPFLLILFGIYLILRGPGKSQEKQFYKSKKDKKLAGVCAGLADYLDIDVSFVRTGFIVFTLLTDLFIGISLYLILIIILPESRREHIKG